MGFNTSLLVCNDIFNQLRKHPEDFVERFFEATSRYSFNESHGQPTEIGVGNAANGCMIGHIAHADVTSVLLAGGNYITHWGSFWSGNGGHHEEADVLRIFKTILETKGYTVTKKRGKR